MLARHRALLLATGIACAVAGRAAEAPPWTDTPVARLEALALLQTLQAEILSSNSATVTLERWCRDHDLSRVPVIRARQVTSPAEGGEVTASTELRGHLRLGPQERVRYRRVELACGAHVLSIAENWYVPGRLTAEMNRLLDTTQTPFGKVIQALHPHRETLAAHLLWSPLPEGWERGASSAAAQAEGTVAAVTQASSPEASPGTKASPPLEIPTELFEHRAIVYTDAQRPIAEVHEIYQHDLLAFPQPRLPSEPVR